jgi:hypothetical protein
MWFRRSPQRASVRHINSCSSKLAVERLESRELLAGNLIENGSFEQTRIQDNWDIVEQLPGWSIVSTSETSNSPIYAQAEIQRHGLNKWKAASGNGQQWLELDGDENGPSSRWNEDPNDARQPISGRPEHGLFSIAQSVPTEIGKTYTLAYDLAARPGVAMPENRMEVAVTDDLGDLQKFATQPTKSNKKQPVWQTQSITFVARSELTNVQFTGLGNDNTLGLLLDDISLTKQPTFTAPTPTNPFTIAAMSIWEELAAAKKKMSAVE